MVRLEGQNTEQPSPYDGFPLDYPVPGPHYSPGSAMEEALGSCKFTGRLTPLTSPWSLHLTVTILSYPYTNNFVFATSISKLNQYAFGDAHTGIKTSEEQGND